MFFRTPRFIRRWFRARMHPMAENKAWSMKEKLSVFYMLVAWNCFGYVVYQMANGKKHWPVYYGLVSEEEESMKRPAYEWAKTLGIKKAEVYRFGNFRLEEKEIIEIKEKEEAAVARIAAATSSQSIEEKL